MLRRFDPVENDVDRRILHEITGKKISHDWYWDTSDENEHNGVDDDADQIDEVTESDPNRHLLKPL